MSASAPPPIRLSPVLRWALLVAGLIAVALAVVGLFLPLLPTVPFLLLALACFTRSSEKCCSWLLDHDHLGPLVRPYLRGDGMPRTAKVKAIALLWTSIGVSVLYLLETLWLRGLLLTIALGVTLYLLRMPTAQVDGQNFAD